MSRCKLSDFKKYCISEHVRIFKVEIDYSLRFSFNSAEVSLVPDGICFYDEAGNCLGIHSIISVYCNNNICVVSSNYFGKEMEIRIICLA